MQYFQLVIFTLTFLVKGIKIKSPIKISRFVKKMSEQKIKEKNEEQTPQKSLEKIFQAEIQITENISEAKEKAEKRVDAARDNVASFKDQIIEKARADREQILAKGVSVAKAGAEKQIEQAKNESKIFKKSSSEFLEEAIQQVESIILGEVKSEEE
jgi:vacuolar-type H+-ATPase subunit H